MPGVYRTGTRQDETYARSGCTSVVHSWVNPVRIRVIFLGWAFLYLLASQKNSGSEHIFRPLIVGLAARTSPASAKNNVL